MHVNIILSIFLNEIFYVNNHKINLIKKNENTKSDTSNMGWK
jgi:hypothetical protein